MSKPIFNYRENIQQCKGCAYWRSSGSDIYCHYLLDEGFAREKTINGNGTDTCHSYMRKGTVNAERKKSQIVVNPKKKPIPKRVADPKHPRTEKEKAEALAEYLFGPESLSDETQEDLYTRLENLLSWIPEDRAAFMWMTVDGKSSNAEIIRDFPSFQPVSKYRVSIRKTLYRLTGLRDENGDPLPVDWNAAIFRHHKGTPLPTQAKDIPIVALDLSFYTSTFLNKAATSLGRPITSVEDIIELSGKHPFSDKNFYSDSAGKELANKLEQFGYALDWAEKIAVAAFGSSAFELDKPDDLANRMTTAMSWLTEKERGTLLMYYRDGKSNDEVNKVYPDPQPQRKVRSKIFVKLRRISGLRKNADGEMFPIDWSSPIFTTPRANLLSTRFIDLPICLLDLTFEEYGYLTRAAADQNVPIASIGDCMDFYAKTNFDGIGKFKEDMTRKLHATLEPYWLLQKAHELQKQAG